MLSLVLVLVRAMGAYFKNKKNWRGVGGEGAAPPPRCIRCKVVVVVVVAVGGCGGGAGGGAGAGAGAGACYGDLLSKNKNWRGVGGEGAAPPPQCIRCKECLKGIYSRCRTWRSFVVVVVAVGGCGGGGGGAYWGLRSWCGCVLEGATVK